MNCINRRCHRELGDGWKFCPWCGKCQADEPKPRQKRPNGTGSVYLRKDNRLRPWAAASSIMGKRTYLGSFKTRTEALNALGEFEHNPTNAFNITLEDLHTRWLATKAYARLSDSSKQGYASAWHKLKPLYGCKFRELRTLDFQAISDYYENPHHEMGTGGRLKYLDKNGKGTYKVTDTPKMCDGLGYSALHNLKCLVTSMYKFALKEDIVNKDYGKFIELPEKDEVNATRFTDVQLEIIRRNVDVVPYMDYVFAMCYLNFRVSEFLELTKESYIVTETGVPILQGGKKTAAGRNRIVPVHPKIQKIIERGIALDGETIFCRKHGAGFGSAMNKDYFLKYCFRPAMQAVDFADTYTPQSCRRTFSTRMSAAGARQEDIIALMGHTDFEIDIKHYIIQEADTLYKAVKKMA